MRRVSASLVVLVATMLAGLAAGGIASSSATSGTLEAGAAVVDATWHVGASAGQYASDGTRSATTARSTRPAAVDAPRRLVRHPVAPRGARARGRGPGRQQVAIVKNDLYIPQDLLYRRTAQILEAGDCRDHAQEPDDGGHARPLVALLLVDPGACGRSRTSSTCASTTTTPSAWRRGRAGAQRTWSRCASAPRSAQFDKTHRHSFGPASPTTARRPATRTPTADHDLTVVRFDDISDPRHPKPLANLVNYSLHAEMLDGNDLISADWVAPLQRMRRPRERRRHDLHAERGRHGRARASHATTRCTSGSSSRTASTAQAEYGARLHGRTRCSKTCATSSRARPEDPRPATFRSMTDFPVAMRTAGSPARSRTRTRACRTAAPTRRFAGDPRSRSSACPTARTATACSTSWPTCSACTTRPSCRSRRSTRASRPTTSSARHPDPRELLGALATPALEEDLGVHMQAFRLGDILFTVCSCEQWVDQAYNIKTRTDTHAGQRVPRLRLTSRDSATRSGVRTTAGT